jgi:glycosyltransferase involved in cell wall biosynthesis
LNILLVHKNCLLGGVETMYAALAPEIKKQGHNCEFFFFRHGPMEEQLPNGSVAHFGDLADYLKVIDSGHFDVVHANSIDWILGISAARNVGAKLLAMAQGRVVQGWTSSNCDAFVACAEWHVKGQNQFTDLPIDVIFNGIDTHVFCAAEMNRPSSPPIVAWIGRGVDDAKQIEKLAAVAPLLKDAGLRLWLAEPHGPDEVDATFPGIKAALLPFVDRWDSIARDNMPQLFQQVAASGGCVLSTSKSEGLPMALVEAQACGCPVIGTDVRGVNECVNPTRGGILYPLETSAKDLADLIVKSLGDTNRMAERRSECVRYIGEHFDVEVMARKYIEVYKKILHYRRRPLRGITTRLRLSPVNWKGYVETRWGPGLNQYEAAIELDKRGQARLAFAASRASFQMCPTLYLRPRRLIDFLRICFRSLLPDSRD